MNRYNFFNVQMVQPTAENLNNATHETSTSATLNATRAQDEYIFCEDAEITKVLRGADSVEVKLSSLPSGDLVNRVTVCTKSGKYVNWRIYGVKDESGEYRTLAAKTYTKKDNADVLAALCGGYCKSGEDFIEDAKRNEYGQISFFRRIYVQGLPTE